MWLFWHLWKENEETSGTIEKCHDLSRCTVTNYWQNHLSRVSPETPQKLTEPKFKHIVKKDVKTNIFFGSSAIYLVIYLLAAAFAGFCLFNSVT